MKRLKIKDFKAQKNQIQINKLKRLTAGIVGAGSKGGVTHLDEWDKQD